MSISNFCFVKICLHIDIEEISTLKRDIYICGGGSIYSSCIHITSWHVTVAFICKFLDIFTMYNSSCIDATTGKLTAEDS